MNFITQSWRKLSYQTRSHLHNFALGASMMIVFAVQSRLFLDRPTGKPLLDYFVLGMIALFYLLIAFKTMKNPYAKKNKR